MSAAAAPVTVRGCALLKKTANVATATANEVASVINNTLTEVSASAVGGRVVLRSHTRGANAQLRVESFAGSLIALESAPRT